MLSHLRGGKTEALVKFTVQEHRLDKKLRPTHKGEGDKKVLIMMDGGGKGGNVTGEGSWMKIVA